MASQDSLFGKLAPGFDFLQNLSKQATQTIPQLPNLSNWVAPTFNVDELDKRIEELKTVQFWLDQNASALAAVIQALEVQKMTLATLKGMNFNMGDVANAFRLKAADTVLGGVKGVVDKAADTARAFSSMAAPAPREAAPKARAPAKRAVASAASKPSKPAAPGLVDPLQWWGALSKQFGDIAANAMKDGAKNAALSSTKSMASGLAKGAMQAATTTANNVTQAAAQLAETASAAAGVGARAKPGAGRSAPLKSAARQVAPKAAPRRAAAAPKAPAKKAPRKR